MRVATRSSQSSLVSALDSGLLLTATSPIFFAMPIASSSRRSLNETAHDSIEDVGSTYTSRRRRVVDDDVDEDEDSQPRRKSSKKGKASMGKKSSIRNEDGSVPGEDAFDDPDRIDIENFKNVPIPRELFGKMKGIKEDWHAIRNAGYKPATESVNNVAISMTEVLEDNKESEKLVEELDSIMREIIDISEESACHEETIHDLYQKLVQGEAIDDLEHQYEVNAKASINKYKRRTTRQKYAKNPEYQMFKETIWSAQHPDEGMPPLTSLISKESGDDSDDEELEIGGITQNIKCPLTFSVLEHPMSSTVCDHSYSREAVREYLKGGQQPCPATGCDKRITWSILKPNHTLERRVKATLKMQERRREEEYDDAEVIE